MAPKLEEYREFVEKLEGQLPSIPLIMNELLKVISDSEVALFTVQNIIKKDKSIFSLILKHSNLLAYRKGSTDRIINITDAIHRLGFDKVKKLIVSHKVFDFIHVRDSGFNLNTFWKHSCGVAIAAEHLAIKFELKLSSYAYVCGLLHDIGKAAKLKFSEKQFFREIRHSKRYNCSNLESEIMLSKLEHDKLGAMIINSWGISPVIEQTTRWHHEPNKEKRIDLEDPHLHKLIDIIFLANYLTKELNFGYSGYSAKTTLNKEFLRRRKIDDQELQNCKEVVQEALEAEAEHLAIFSKE